MIPWWVGRCLVWDVTATNHAATHLPLTSLSTGATAEATAARKLTKYTDLSVDNNFLPLTFETLGPFSHDTFISIKELGRHLFALIGNKGEKIFTSKFVHYSAAF